MFCLIGYFGVCVPVECLLLFGFELDVFGVWAGMAIGVWSLAIMLRLFVGQLDFAQEALTVTAISFH